MKKHLDIDFYLCYNTPRRQVDEAYSSYASVAQLVEQRTENPRVVGSIPTGGTSGIDRYADLAHLVERDLAKVEVAGSSPVIRSRIADANRIHSHPLFSDLFPSLFRFFPLPSPPLIFHLMAP